MNSTVRLLWVDDDNDDEGLLGGLMLHFSAKKIDPVRAHGFEEGLRNLRKMISESGSEESVIILSDVVLPQVLGMGALAWDLGIKLAMEAAKLGVRKVGFLTVVQVDEIENELAELVQLGCCWRLFSKPALLENDNIDRMLSFLMDFEKGDSND